MQKGKKNQDSGQCWQSIVLFYVSASTVPTFAATFASAFPGEQPMISESQQQAWADSSYDGQEQMIGWTSFLKTWMKPSPWCDITKSLCVCVCVCFWNWQTLRYSYRTMQKLLYYLVLLYIALLEARTQATLVEIFISRWTNANACVARKTFLSHHLQIKVASACESLTRSWPNEQ